jgi:hypothetical protein
MLNKILLIVFAVMFVLLQLLVLNYLFQLETIGCACAMDWRRSFIMFYLVLGVLNIFISAVVDESHIPYLQTIMVVVGVLNIIFTVQYVQKLKREKCECSQSVYRDVMVYVSIFNAIIYSSILLYVVYALYTVANFVKTSSGRLQGTAKASKKALTDIKPLKKLKKALKGKPKK